MNALAEYEAAMRKERLHRFGVIPGHVPTKEEREALIASIAQGKPTRGERDEQARLDEMQRRFHRTPREI